MTQLLLDNNNCNKCNKCNKSCCKKRINKLKKKLEQIQNERNSIIQKIEKCDIIAYKSKSEYKSKSKTKTVGIYNQNTSAYIQAEGRFSTNIAVGQPASFARISDSSSNITYNQAQTQFTLKIGGIYKVEYAVTCTPDKRNGINIVNATFALKSSNINIEGSIYLSEFPYGDDNITSYVTANGNVMFPAEPNTTIELVNIGLTNVTNATTMICIERIADL
jgi:hypothetical protein